MISRAHFGSIPIAHVEIGMDEPRFRWIEEHGTLHIPDVRLRRTIFQWWVPLATCAVG